MRNISLGGALLDFGQHVSVPFRFSLRIEGREQPINCEVTRHLSTAVGVSFKTPLERLSN